MLRCEARQSPKNGWKRSSFGPTDIRMPSASWNRQESNYDPGVGTRQTGWQLAKPVSGGHSVGRSGSYAHRRDDLRLPIQTGLVGSRARLPSDLSADTAFTAQGRQLQPAHSRVQEGRPPYPPRRPGCRRDHIGGQAELCTHPGGGRIGAQRLEWERGRYDCQALHRLIEHWIYHDQPLTEQLKTAGFSGLVAFIAGIILAIPSERERMRIWKHGRQLKGPEMVRSDEFNQRYRSEASASSSTIATGFNGGGGRRIRSCACRMRPRPAIS